MSEIIRSNGYLPNFRNKADGLNLLTCLPEQSIKTAFFDPQYRKCMGREVVVQPNPRVHKALKTQMAAILAELERIAAGDSVPDELLSTIDLIAVTMYGLKGADAYGR